MNESKSRRNKIQIFRNEIQAGWNKIQIQSERNPNSDPSLFLRRIATFQPLAPILYSISLGRVRLQTPRQSEPRLFARVHRRSFGLRFQFVRPCQAREGLAPFRDRGRSGALRPTCRPRSLMSAKKGSAVDHQSPGHKPGDARTRAEDGRSIRRPAEIRPLHQARTGFGPMDKRTGASPSCLRVSHDPCLQYIPSVSPIARRMRPLSVGRLENAFHPTTDQL